jgi:hypothetical protein
MGASLLANGVHSMLGDIRLQASSHSGFVAGSVGASLLANAGPPVLAHSLAGKLPQWLRS